MTLSGQVAIVSGASMGIGRAAVIELAKAGCDVGINFRSHREDAEKVASEVRSLGRRALLLPGDVADQNAVEAMTQLVVKEFGRLDVAVTNACYSDREAFHTADMPGFHRTIDVTMWGAFYLLRGATNRMIEQSAKGAGQGPDSVRSIVVISSPHAYIPVPKSMAYNMAKGAIDQMAKTAAIELVDHRIRVNLIHPGWIDTPGERKFTSDEQLIAAGKRLPWKRLGRPEEIGRAVVFLCQPESDYITGTSLGVDGGITLPWWANRGSAVPE